MTNLLKELQNEFEGIAPQSNARDLLRVLSSVGTIEDITHQDDGRQVHIKYKSFQYLTSLTPKLYRDFGLVLLGQSHDENRVWFCTKEYMSEKHAY